MNQKISPPANVKQKLLKKSAKFGFGSNKPRFNYTGLHPGLFIQNTEIIGPMKYSPNINVICNKSSQESPWFRKVKLEEFSKFLGFRNEAILKERAFRATVGGPGTYDLPSIFQGPEPSSLCYPILKGFGTLSQRFGKSKEDNIPPPGTYNIKQTKTKFGTTPHFEFDNKAIRIKMKEPHYHLPPNLYDVKIPKIVDKVLTKRGPYDTFTGPRDNTTIKNHFASPFNVAPDKFYDINECGKFLEADRFYLNKWPTLVKGLVTFAVDQDYPAPNQYNLGTKFLEPKATKFKGAFFCHQTHARPKERWLIFPGPERYKPRISKCMRKHKNTWNFLSYRKPFVVKSYTNF